jgi:hypothetical protein
MAQIEAGKTYWVTVESVQFKVHAIRRAAIKGWWLCETANAGDRLMVPEHVLTPEEDEKSS